MKLLKETIQELEAAVGRVNTEEINALTELLKVLTTFNNNFYVYEDIQQNAQLATAESKEKGNEDK